MLVVPPRAELRHRPLDTPRLLLVPVEPADAPDLWSAVDSSRAHLEKVATVGPLNTDLDASWRYCEASASDWDHARALRFSIRERTTRRFLGVVGLESACPPAQERGARVLAAGGRRAPRLHVRSRPRHRRMGLQAAERPPDPRGCGDRQRGLARGNSPRLGFRYEGSAREAERCQGRWLNHALFALLASDSIPPSPTTATT